MNINDINCFEKQIKLFPEPNVLQAILIEILDSFIKHSEQKETAFPVWLQQLLPFLDKPETFTKDIPSLLKDTNLTHSYICTTFKKHLGMTITEYRKEAKLQYAYSLLLSSSLSIQQIYEQCGFESRAYFYKEFKKKFGIKPGDLRKN